jgi:hypothetical protein
MVNLLGLGNVSGLSGLVKLASVAGMIDDKTSILVAGVKRAPAPKQTSFGNDWLKNGDVMLHGIGCMVCGVFDEIVEGETPETIKSLQAEKVGQLFGQTPFMSSLVAGSFDVCRELYFQHGDLTDAVDRGDIDPGGIILQAGILPALQGRKARKANPLALITGEDSHMSV